MKPSKQKQRAQRRKAAWENSKLNGRNGFKAPGSNKKPFPKGSR